MKLYGKVVAIKTNNKGVHYVKVEDLNNEGKTLVVSSGDVDSVLGGVNVEVGQRIACALKRVEGVSVLAVDSAVRVYKDQPKRGDYKQGILFGNAVNVASILAVKKKLNKEELFSLAKEIFGKVTEGREKLLSKFPEEKEQTLGAIFGDSLKRAAEFTDARKKIDIEELISEAIEFATMQVEAEKAL